MVSKQNMLAVVLIILGIGLTQLKPLQSFTMGLGVGIIVMASAWIVLIIIKDIKKK
ncbi:MAG: hypothetical protein ACREAD_08150 [Nitrosopumilaceae archaeon]